MADRESPKHKAKKNTRKWCKGKVGKLHQPKWEQVEESFAEVKPLCDNRFILLEGMQFGNVITEEYFLFTTRFIKDIDKTVRISFHNQIFEIKRIIDEDSKGRMLGIVALKV